LSVIDGETLIRNVGRRIAELRQSKGLTQEAFAAKARVDARYVQKVERGIVNLTLVTLAQWAARLGVEPAELLRPPRSAAVTRGRPRNG
jgi:transcriptional regulator with XRE-family HTH domain